MALGVGGGGDGEAVVELEGGGGEVFKSGKGDAGGDGERAGGGDEVGVDGIGGDLELLVQGRGVRGCGGEDGGESGEQAAGGSHVEILENIFRQLVRRWFSWFGWGGSTAVWRGFGVMDMVWAPLPSLLAKNIQTMGLDGESGARMWSKRGRRVLSSRPLCSCFYFIVGVKGLGLTRLAGCGEREGR